ncbi:MAG: sugar phosphate isomerase/epimerase family protein [Bacteroidota bacterium]
MEISRRNLIKSASITGLGMAIPEEIIKPKKKHNFTFSLNTSTIREQNLGLIGEMEVAAKAGYDAIEIWMNTLQKYVDAGGSLKDVRKRAADLNLKIEDAIGFAKWIVDDPAERAKALEQNKKEMGMLAEIGCPRIAAPPFGATNIAKIDLSAVAERYARLLEVGDQAGVIPQLEMWGFSTNLHLLGEAMFVAAESGHPNAIVLSDIYHLHKGGSSFNSLKMLNGKGMQMFHVNDYPKEPPREKIVDSDRIFPGDGVAPLAQVYRELNSKNVPIVLSLELFNKDYWKMDALLAAKTGLEKMKATVNAALNI